MDFEEIEDVYKKELDNAEKGFLEERNSKKSKNDAENNYKEKLKKAREKYYSSVGDLIEKQKKQKIKTPKKKRERVEHFISEEGRYEISIYQRLKLKSNLFLFKFRIYLKNKKRAMTPYFLSILFIKSKIKIKSIFGKINDTTATLKEKIKNLAEISKEGIKERLKKLYEKINSFPEKFFSLFRRKKVKPEENENKSN